MTTTLYAYDYDCTKCGKHCGGESITPHEGTLCFDCERTEENKAAGFATKTCKTCGVEIAPRRPEVEYCGICGHIAYCESYEESYKDVIEFLQERVNVNASVSHTGGGCMAIHIQSDGYYLLVTDDEGPLVERPELTGWMVGVYDDAAERFDGSEELDVINDPSLDALGTLMERFIKHLRDDVGIDAFEYGTV